MRMEDFKANQARPLPPLKKVDMTGKTVLITGANTGIGFEIMRYYLDNNVALVIMACRSMEKAEEAKQRILTETGREQAAVRIEKVDFASFASVKQSASNLLKTVSSLHVLHSHAGLGMLDKQLTENGFETVAQVNALACMQYALALHPLLVKTAQAEEGRPTRSVFTCTDGIYFAPEPTGERPMYTMARLAEFKDENETMWHYCTTKLYLAYMVREYASRIAGQPVAVFLAAPGLTSSEFGQKSHAGTLTADKVDFESIGDTKSRTNAEGAKTIIVAATEDLSTWNWSKDSTADAVRLSNSVLEPAPENTANAVTRRTIWNELPELLGNEFAEQIPNEIM